MKRFLLVVMFLLISLIHAQSYAQRASYADQCKLVQDLFEIAAKTFFDFPRMTNDSPMVILDVDNILISCFKDSFGALRINLISSGIEFEKVQKESIFSAQTNRRNFFIFTKESLYGLTGFRIFHPMSGGQCYWGFRKKKALLVFNKKSFGWF